MVYNTDVAKRRPSGLVKHGYAHRPLAIAKNRYALLYQACRACMSLCLVCILMY